MSDKRNEIIDRAVGAQSAGGRRRKYSDAEQRRILSRATIGAGASYRDTKRGTAPIRSTRQDVAFELARMGNSLADFDAMQAEAERDMRAGRRVDDRTNAFLAYLRTGRPSSALVESRDMGFGTNGAGGYLVPPGRFEAELLLSVQYHSALTNKSRKWNTETGSTAFLPLALTDTANSALAFAENTQNDEADLSLSRVTFGETPNYIASDLIRVGNALLRDATYDVSASIAQAYGQRIGAAVDAANMATVLANGSIPVVTTAANNAITNGDLMSLFYTLDAVYRGSDSVALIVSKNTAKAIRAITDTAGTFVVRDSEMVIEQADTSLYGDGTLQRSMKVATFRGIPILESPNVGDITASGVVGVVASWEDAFVTRVVTGSVAIRVSQSVTPISTKPRLAVGQGSTEPLRITTRPPS